MSATKPQLVTVTMEEARLLNSPHTEHKWYEAIKMATQKALTPSIAISPASIALAMTLVLHTAGIMWWASGTSKDLADHTKKIEKLESELDTQRVYKEDVGRKLAEVKAILQTLQINEQTKKLLEQLVDERLTEKEQK